MREKLWGAVSGLVLWVVSLLPGVFAKQVTGSDLVAGGVLAILGLLASLAITSDWGWKRWGFEVRKAATRRPPEIERGSPAVPGVAAPEIHIRVHRAVSETGNSASQSWRRWLHLEAQNWSTVIARNATVRIRVRPIEVERDWRWTDARDHIKELKRGLPIAIPIAAGDIANPPKDANLALLVGYTHANHLPIGKWYLTPEASLVDRAIEVAPGRLWLDVTVAWDGGNATDAFVMDLPSGASGCDALITHTVVNEFY